MNKPVQQIREDNVYFYSKEQEGPFYFSVIPTVSIEL
jgi:hypothetical protein